MQQMKLYNVTDEIVLYLRKGGLSSYKTVKKLRTFVDIPIISPESLTNKVNKGNLTALNAPYPAPISNKVKIP